MSGNSGISPGGNSIGGLLWRALLLALAAAAFTVVGWMVIGGRRPKARRPERTIPPARKLHPSMQSSGERSGAIGDDVIEALSDEEQQRLLDELGRQL